MFFYPNKLPIFMVLVCAYIALITFGKRLDNITLFRLCSMVVNRLINKLSFITIYLPASLLNQMHAVSIWILCHIILFTEELAMVSLLIFHCHILLHAIIVCITNKVKKHNISKRTCKVNKGCKFQLSMTCRQMYTYITKPNVINNHWIGE